VSAPDSAPDSPADAPEHATASEPVTAPIGPPWLALGRGPRPDRPGLGWTELAIAAVSYVGLQLVLVGGAAVLSGGTPASGWLVAGSAASALGAVGLALSARVRSLTAVGLRRVPGRTLVTAVGLGIVVWVVSRLLIVAYIAVTGDTADPQEALTLFRGPVSVVVVVALGGLVVPFGEELLFRGVGYGALRRYGRVVAAVATALVFALAHGLNVVFSAALVLGLLNAALYERTRSIWPCVAAHATFNLISFGLVLALR